MTYTPATIIGRTSPTVAPKKLKVLLYGPPGTGKTTYAGSAPKVLFLAIEDGTLSVRKTGIDKFVITTWNDLEDALFTLMVEKHSYESVAVDSITAMQYLAEQDVGLMEVLLADSDPRRAYGKIGAMVRHKISQFMSLDMHVVITAQLRFNSGDEDKDQSAGRYPLVPDVTPSIYRTLTSAPDVIGRTHHFDTGKEYEYRVQFGPEYLSITKQRDLELPDTLTVTETEKQKVVPLLIARAAKAQENKNGKA